MKRIVCCILSIVLIFSCLTASGQAVNRDASFLIGDWSTSDGIYLSFYDDETFYLEWGSYYLVEEGRWSTGSMTDDSFTIHMDGSSILTLMSLIYGLSMSDYHFEVLKCNDNNFYLVQVYDDYTAKTSPCKLAFTRDGEQRNFSYSDDVKPTEKLKENPTKKASVWHKIKNDNGDSRVFSFRENEELEDLVLSQKSTEYNPRLAHFLSYMARAAYNQSLVGQNYSELGFDYTQEHYNDGDPIAGFTIGKKQLQNGKKIVLISVRGSSNINEWLETNFNLGNDAMIASVGLHSGFLASANEVHSCLKRYLGGTIPTQDVTYVITGHSLGAAVSNVLSVILYNSDKVSNSDVYTYTYACPNVGMGADSITAWNDQGIHNNIINIGNWCDMVTHQPGFAVESLSLANRQMCLARGWTKWKRFGVSYWFDNGFQLWIPAHDMSTYIDYLEKEYEASRFRDKEYAVRSTWIYCPVDVVIYDSQGDPIAGTVNNEPDYYQFDKGEKAFIIVNEDRKLFYLMTDEQCEVHLKAIDEGEMEYGTAVEDLTSGDIQSEIRFTSVKLTNGKEMVSRIGGTVNTSDVKLYVVDENDQVIAEIMKDGSEKIIESSDAISLSDIQAEEQDDKAFPLWGYFLIIGGAGLLIGAAVVLIILQIRQKKAAARRKKAADSVELYW